MIRYPPASALDRVVLESLEISQEKEKIFMLPAYDSIAKAYILLYLIHFSIFSTIILKLKEIH